MEQEGALESTQAIIAGIYDAALGEGEWSHPLVGIADDCGMANTALVVVDSHLDYACVTAPRADPDVVDAYNSEWWAYDPTVKATSAAPVGHLTTLADTGREEFVRSAFHGEFWSRSGLGVERVATNLLLSDGAFASCVLQPSPQRDEIDDSTLRRFAGLTPHLVRAVTIQRKIQRLAMGSVLSEAATGSIRAAAMVVDADCRLVCADEAGERMLEAGEGITVRRGRIALADPDAHLNLKRAVKAASGIYFDLPANGPVHVDRGEHAAKLAIDVMPYSPALQVIDLFSPRPAALLCIHEVVDEPSQVPQQENSTTVSPAANGRETRFAAIKEDIRQNLANADLSLGWLSRRHRMTPRAIRNLFYAENTSFTDWLINARLDRARDMLADPLHRDTNIATIALDSGFGDLSWFHQAFRRRFGVTPTQMRAKG